MSYTWPETLTFGEREGAVSSRSTSARTVVCGSATAAASSAASGRPVAWAAWCRKPGSARKLVPHWVWWTTATSKRSSATELESEDDCRVDPVVEAGEDEHRLGGHAE